MQDPTQTTDQNNSQNQQQNDESKTISQPVGYSHIGSLQKEQGVGFSEGEMIKPTEEEPKISDEVKEAGVEKVSELPKIGEEHEKIGIKHAKETTSVSAALSSSGVSLPQTQQGIKNLIKTKNPVQSFFWFLTLFLKQLKKGGRN